FRLEINHAADGWHLAAGPHDFGPIARNEYQARTAMQIAQRYPLTEFIRIGTGDFTFYLSEGSAPRGVPLGVRSFSFEPRSLTVTRAGNRWLVGDGRQSVATFASAEEAQLAVKVIQHYGFNCICQPTQSFNILAQDR